MHSVYVILGHHSPLSRIFDMKSSKNASCVWVFYSNVTESYLSINMGNHGRVAIKERNQMAKCPKCGSEVSKPKKTWKLAGRPDKQGKRMQLEIALYDCPKGHGAFREVLSKKKI